MLLYSTIIFLALFGTFIEIKSHYNRIIVIIGKYLRSFFIFLLGIKS